MESDNTKINNYSLGNHNFELVSKADFGMSKDNQILPKPSPFYHYHDRYELYYLYSGELYYFIKDKTYHVKSGNLVLVDAYDIHATTNFAEFGYNRMLINFKKEFIASFLNSINSVDLFACFRKNIHVIRLNASEQFYIENMLQFMFHEYTDQPEGFQTYLQTALIQLLLFMNRHNDPLSEKPVSYINSTHKTISEITGYINTHYYEDITLDSISGQFFISPCYFSRTFKKFVGYSFTEYLNGVRIKEAQKLLLHTNLHITEISEMVGYKSSTHFGRIFKDIIGTSPLAYRKGQL